MTYSNQRGGGVKSLRHENYCMGVYAEKILQACQRLKMLISHDAFMNRHKISKGSF